ncbi:MAG: KH domain-containing protein [Oscillospiraceae bacterium]|nr:KH domain-containing protein [Oscillospiraceae bacterium]
MENIFSDKTSLQEAKNKMYAFFAAQGINEDDISYEIIEQPVKKLFGGMKGEFKVKVAEEFLSKVAEMKAAAAQKAAAKAQLAKETTPSTVTKKTFHEKPTKTIRQPVKTALSQETTEQQAQSQSIIVNYLTNILTGLGAKDFKIDIIKKENLTVFDIVGDKLGIAIGRRGETLDALQYLAILAGNRSGVPFNRISVDCNSYREKRTETLESLAVRTAKKVLAQGRRITLEPMNPYERRVIHGKVSEIEGVYSSSIGDEPFRKVVVSASVPKHRRPLSRDNREGGYRDNRTVDYSDRPSYKKSSGFSTSFERDYKRTPSEKVEISQDSLDFEKSTSLYGKIEL